MVGLALLATVIALAGGSGRSWVLQPVFRPRPRRRQSCGISATAMSRPASGATFPAVSPPTPTGPRLRRRSAQSPILEFDPLGTSSGPGAGTWWKAAARHTRTFEVCVPEEGDVCKAGFSAPARVSSARRWASRSTPAASVCGRLRQQPRAEVRSQRRLPVDVRRRGQQNQRRQRLPRPGFRPTCARTTPAAGGGGDRRIRRGVETHRNRPRRQRLRRRRRAGSSASTRRRLPGRDRGARETVQSLAVDPAGNLYFIYENQCRAQAGHPAGEREGAASFEIPQTGLAEAGRTRPTGVAVDASGHVYAFSARQASAPPWRPDRRSSTPPAAAATSSATERIRPQLDRARRPTSAREARRRATST